MITEGVNIDIKPISTKEQIEYEEALKNMRYVTAKLRLSQEGINTYNISQQILETAIKLFDEMDLIQRDFNIGMHTIQQETDNKMRELQTGANKKLGDAQNRYRELINSMKNEITENDKKKMSYEDIGVSQEKIAETEDILKKSLGAEKEKEIQKMLADELAKSQK